MDDWLRLLLQLEVERQSGFALDAYDEMTAALAADDSRRFWRATQTFLSSAANVSKLLWGVGRTPVADREELRVHLHVPDTSPLKDRKLRDHFEHFDERIVQYALDHPKGDWADDYIGTRSDYGDEPILRFFDPDEQCFWHYDEPYPLEPWVAALRDVRAVALERRPF